MARNRCGRFLLLLTLWSVLSTERLAAQAEHGSSPAIPVLQRINNLEVHAAVVPLSLENSGVEPITIQSLTFIVEEGDIKVDPQPNLVIQLIPFFDALCIKISNIGWGPYLGTSFELFTPLGLADEIGPALLFDIKRSNIPLTRVDDEQYLFFPVGPQAQAFNYVTTPLFEGRYNPSATVGPPRSVTESYAVSKMVPESRLGDAPFSGTVQFDGNLVLDSAKTFRVPYLGRSLATVEASPRS